MSLADVLSEGLFFDTEVSWCDVAPESVPIHEAKLCVFIAFSSLCSILK